MAGRPTKDLPKVSREERARWAEAAVVDAARLVLGAPSDRSVLAALQARLLELDRARQRCDVWRKCG